MIWSHAVNPREIKIQHYLLSSNLMDEFIQFRNIGQTPLFHDLDSNRIDSGN